MNFKNNILLSILAFLIMLVTLSSCKEDEMVEKDEANLVGTWLFESLEFESLEFEGSLALLETLSETIFLGSKFIFNAAGTFELKIQEDSGEGTWMLQNKTLTLMGEDDDIHFEIRELSSTTLVLVVEIEEFEDANLILTYTKQ